MALVIDQSMTFDNMAKVNDSLTAASEAFTPYDQVFQQLLDPTGLFASNPRGVNVALVRFDDWCRDESPVSLDIHARRLVEAVRSAASKFSAPLNPFAKQLNQYLKCVLAGAS